MSDATQVLARIATALKGGRFRVRRGVKLSDGKKADIVAWRTYFSWKGLMIISQHVVVRHVDNATGDDAEELFEAGFCFGKKANKIRLFRGLQFGYIIIPVIVGESPGRVFAKDVRRPPRRHWALFELPVYVNLPTSQTLFFKGTDAWGAAFFSDMRKVAYLIKRAVSKK